MFVTVRISSELPEGTLVCHGIDNVWRVATSSDVAPLGVVSGVQSDDESNVWARVTLAGSTWARAGANIPSEGGWLSCDDQGRAVVTTTEDCGMIAPLSRGATAPNVDDLILVYLR